MKNFSLVRLRELQSFFLASVICVTICQRGASQWFEDFSDSDLQQGVVWTGDLSSFVVENDRLRLDDDADGVRSLWTLYEINDSAAHVWTGNVLLDFAPSGSNRVEIVLWADQDAVDFQNGMKLQWGESGSEDRLEVIRRVNGADEVMAQGMLGGLAQQPSSLIYRLELFQGEFSLYASYEGVACLDLESQWSPLVSVDPGSYYFGINCEFTTSRNDLFFFDDFSFDIADFAFGEEVSWESLEFVDSSTLALSISGPVDSSYYLNPDIYTISGSTVSVLTAAWQGDALWLVLSQALDSGDSLSVAVNGFLDCNGILTPGQTMTARFLRVDQPQFQSIQWTEIMADPNPSVGLPEDIEWLEIVNASGSYVQASDLYFYRNGNLVAQLPESLLPPQSYWILCDPEDVLSLQSYGSVLAVEGFPALSNGGDRYELQDGSGKLIDMVDWTSSWYADPQKDDGGYTLSKKRLDSPCESASNWMASVSDAGGTPGRENLVFDSADFSLDILEFELLDSTTLRLRFNQRLDSMSLTTGLFGLEPVLSISEVLLSEDETELRIHLAEALDRGIVYTFTALMDILDCDGEGMMEDREYELVRPFEPESGDLLITEILFDPEVGGSDYLEILNASDKLLSTDGLIVRNSLREEEKEFPRGILLQPGQWWVWTEDSTDVTTRYLAAHPDRVRIMDVPGWNRDEGDAVLIYESPQGRIQIDSMTYTEDLHFELLDETKGVALERIFEEVDGWVEDNWASAASPIFGTPTGVNSQAGRLLGEEGIRIAEPVFSPDGDGYRDQLTVEYSFESGGNIGTARIFNAQGAEVFAWLGNELLGTQGILRWDGLDADGNLLPFGRYIVLIEYFDVNGNTGRFKDVCVLAAQLD